MFYTIRPLFIYILTQ